MPPLRPTESKMLEQISKMKRIDFRWLTSQQIDGLRILFGRLYVSEKLSTTEIGNRLGKSQQFAWSMCDRLGIDLRTREEGGRIYAPKRTSNAREPFNGTNLDRAYLQGFAHGDLDVRRASSLAIMVSTTTTHPDFVSLFKSLFQDYGPVYVYPTYDEERGYRWKVATRLDNSFAFMLPDQRVRYPEYRTTDEFFAWLAGLVDSDGSVGMIHSEKYVRTNIQIANEEVGLLRHIKTELRAGGYHPSGPYRTSLKGHVTQAWNIVYNEDMYYLTLQRFEEVRKILRSLPLKHREKRLRRDMVLSFHKPLLWKKWEQGVESSRERIRDDVDEFVRLAEVRYKERSHKRRRESPTS